MITSRDILRAKAARLIEELTEWERADKSSPDAPPEQEHAAKVEFLADIFSREFPHGLPEM